MLLGLTGGICPSSQKKKIESNFKKIQNLINKTFDYVLNKQPFQFSGELTSSQMMHYPIDVTTYRKTAEIFGSLYILFYLQSRCQSFLILI